MDTNYHNGQGACSYCTDKTKISQKKNCAFFCLSSLPQTKQLESIRKGASKDTVFMHLLRYLWFFTAHYSIHITATHLPGAQNTEANLMSRNKLQQFFISHPTASHLPTPIPFCLAQIVSPTKLDWTSPHSLSYFKQIIQLAA